MAHSDSVSDEARELVDLVVGYAKQETLEPLKGLGRNVAFGVAGALMVGIGAIFLSLAALRALQSETEWFEDNLSWAPYGIVAGLLAILTLATWAALGPGRERGGRR